MKGRDFSISFAGITIRFCLPSEIVLPEELEKFEFPNSFCENVKYEVDLLEEPLMLTEKPFENYQGIEIYPYKDGWLRVYSQLTTKERKQVACFTNKSDNNILYYPDTKWEYYSEPWNCLHLLGIEEVLLRHNALLLHSSFVQIHGQMVLFAGPSGIGKSTQAALWEKYLSAEIINGDRCVIRKIEDIFYGCGSPWAGTSEIYRKEIAPIKGIFILKQAKENSVRKLRAEAFADILRQTIVNTWNLEFMDKVSTLIIELLSQIPVYELSCRPDESAVKLAYQILFEGSNLNEVE